MKKSFFIILSLLIITYSCSIKYSLTGASIAPAVKTISVEYFDNRAPLAMAGLEQRLTDALRDKFKSQTDLALVNEMGHLNFSGQITGYSTKPLAVTSAEVAAQNRLTITIHVKFTNEIEPQYNFDQSFSQFEDYNSDQDLSAVEQELVEKITVKLIEDIFNKAVVNW
ncbi:MAG: LPS assembly lipoprotein LptE [Bacteroidales bacterium]|nr:LPS assembly lipoprotein LptE [Bacteroidales bacterium]